MIGSVYSLRHHKKTIKNPLYIKLNRPLKHNTDTKQKTIRDPKHPSTAPCNQIS